MSCRDFFAVLTGREDRSKAAILDEAKPQCQCQAGSVSIYSSGPVDNEEMMLRILVAPQHGKGGKPRSSALTDAEKNGLSVFRKQQATDEEIRRIAERLIANARARNDHKSGVFGILEIRSGSARTLTDDDSDDGVYCVYDTALVETPSHAEIYQRTHETDPSITIQRRTALFNLVRDSFISVNDFRNGLLSDLAPKLD